MKIDIPSVLVHLRGRVVRERAGERTRRAGGDAGGGPDVRDAAALRAGAAAGARAGRGPLARLPVGPLGGWTRPATCPRSRRRASASGGGRARERRASEMLARIRAALGAEPPVPEIPRGYRRAGRRGAESAALVERFSERVAAYRATVRRVAAAEELAAAIAAACGSAAAARSPRRRGAQWRARRDRDRDRRARPLTARELDSVDAALTGCALAIAETGTIVLDGEPLCGRRALTLVPDHHVCVVRADQIVASVPDAIDALGPAARERPARSPSSPGRRRPRTSSSSGSRACTARGGSTSWSSPPASVSASRPRTSPHSTAAAPARRWSACTASRTPGGPGSWCCRRSSASTTCSPRPLPDTPAGRRSRARSATPCSPTRSSGRWTRPGSRRRTSSATRSAATSRSSSPRVAGRGPWSRSRRRAAGPKATSHSRDDARLLHHDAGAAAGRGPARRRDRRLAGGSPPRDRVHRHQLRAHPGRAARPPDGRRGELRRRSRR